MVIFSTDMAFLSPLGLVWLASIPVLIWLWRFAASRQRTIIPSLVPFEHLLRRPPTRRSRLILNWLFWLQLAALSLISLALAQPVLVGPKARTILVLVDTSASMAASTKHGSPLHQVKRSVLGRLTHKGLRDQWFVVRTAPVSALAAEPTGDGVQLSQIIQGLSTADLGGNLALANRIGRAFLGRRPDETWVFTDEPPPTDPINQTTQFHSVGEPLANVAIVGLDANEPLCAPAEAQLVVTIQNYADVEQEVTLSVSQDRHAMTQVARRLAPQGRLSIPLSMPPGAAGVFDVTLLAQRDALAVDNHVSVTLRGTETIPVVVASGDARFVATVGGWLDACPRVAWRQAPATLQEASPSDILITDRLELAAQWPKASIGFVRTREGWHLVPTQWMVESTHPIGEYLEPLQSMAAAVAPSSADGQWGDPIIWGVVGGQKVPLVRASSSQGRRMVSVFVDPTASPSSTSLVVVFLNSLRWVTGSQGLVITGDRLTVGPFAQGLVRIQRPDGSVILQAHDGGVLHYDATTSAGRYRFLQGQQAIERVVNFLDPIESNTIRRVSTWGTDATPLAQALVTERPRQSLVNWLLSVLVVVLLLEWMLYAWKGHRQFARLPRVSHGGQGVRPPAPQSAGRAGNSPAPAEAKGGPGEFGIRR